MPDASRIRSDRLARRLEDGWKRIEAEQNETEKENLLLFWLKLLKKYEQAYDQETEEAGEA